MCRRKLNLSVVAVSFFLLVFSTANSLAAKSHGKSDGQKDLTHWKIDSEKFGEFQAVADKLNLLREKAKTEELSIDTDKVDSAAIDTLRDAYLAIGGYSTKLEQCNDSSYDKVKALIDRAFLTPSWGTFIGSSLGENSTKVKSALGGLISVLRDRKTPADLALAEQLDKAGKILFRDGLNEDGSIGDSNDKRAVSDAHDATRAAERKNELCNFEGTTETEGPGTGEKPGVGGDKPGDGYTPSEPEGGPGAGPKVTEPKAAAATTPNGGKPGEGGDGKKEQPKGQAAFIPPGQFGFGPGTGSIDPNGLANKDDANNLPALLALAKAMKEGQDDKQPPFPLAGMGGEKSGSGSSAPPPSAAVPMQMPQPSQQQPPQQQPQQDPMAGMQPQQPQFPFMPPQPSTSSQDAATAQNTQNQISNLKDTVAALKTDDALNKQELAEVSKADARANQISPPSFGGMPFGGPAQGAMPQNANANTVAGMLGGVGARQVQAPGLMAAARSTNARASRARSGRGGAWTGSLPGNVRGGL